jgi:hypothetical protein
LISVIKVLTKNNAEPEREDADWMFRLLTDMDRRKILSVRLLCEGMQYFVQCLRYLRHLCLPRF